MLGSAGTWDLQSANLLAALPGSAGCHTSLPHPRRGTQEDTQLPSTLPSPRCQGNAGSHSLRDLRTPSWSSRAKGRGAGRRLRLHGLWGCCWNQGTKSEPHSLSREQPAGMQLEPGLAGAEGSPLSAPPRLPGLRPLTHPTPHPFCSPAPSTPPPPPSLSPPPHLPPALSSHPQRAASMYKQHH